MRTTQTLFYILLQLFIFLPTILCDESDETIQSETETEDIINPHSLGYDKFNKRMLTIHSPEPIRKQDEVQNDVSYNTDDCERGGTQEAVFYKRLVRLLLSKMSMKDDGNFVTGMIYIEVHSSEIETLRDFGNGVVSIKQVDGILSRAIKKTAHSHILDTFYTIKSVLSILKEHERIVYVFVLSILSIFAVRNIRLTPMVIFFLFITSVFLASFFIMWYQLIQDAEIKLMARQMQYRNVPISCQPDKMSWWHKLASMFSKDDCEEYYKTILSDPKLQVTPALVISHLCTTVILHPMKHAGTALSEFISNATAELPIFLRLPVTILLFLCVPIFLIIFLSLLPFCLFGGSINLGPLFRYSIGGFHKLGSATQKEKREPIEVILNVTHTTDAIEMAKKTKVKPAVTVNPSICGGDTGENDKNGCLLEPVEHLEDLNSNEDNFASGDATANQLVLTNSEKKCNKCCDEDTEKQVRHEEPC